MKINSSNSVELFYERLGEPVELHPRFNVDESHITAPTARSLTDGIPLDDQMERKPDSSICFYRTYALGDLILLTPVFNWLKQKYPDCKVTLATATNYMKVFRYWDMIQLVSTNRVGVSKYDVGYFMNGVVEVDHQGNEFSYKNRVQLYCEFLQIPTPEKPVFSLPYSEVEGTWARNVISAFRREGMPVVVMQVGGSNLVKRIPIGKLMAIAGELVKTCDVIFAHNFPEAGKIEKVLDLSGQTNVHELAALVDNADAVVTMDSGLLWIAHSTKTPVIALLGPTRPEERLNFHSNSRVVNLAKMVGCKPCFESMNYCSSQVPCMRNIEPKLVAEEIAAHVRELVYS